MLFKAELLLRAGLTLNQAARLSGPAPTILRAADNKEAVLLTVVRAPQEAAVLTHVRAPPEAAVLIAVRAAPPEATAQAVHPAAAVDPPLAAAVHPVAAADLLLVAVLQEAAALRQEEVAVPAVAPADVRTRFHRQDPFRDSGFPRTKDHLL